MLWKDEFLLMMLWNRAVRLFVCFFGFGGELVRDQIICPIFQEINRIWKEIYDLETFVLNR